MCASSLQIDQQKIIVLDPRFERSELHACLKVIIIFIESVCYYTVLNKNFLVNKYPCMDLNCHK